MWNSTGRARRLVRVEQDDLGGLALDHLDRPFVGVLHVEYHVGEADLDEAREHAIDREPAILIGK